jgi:hypothetical protein
MQERINAEHLDQILIKTKILEQIVLFEIVLKQYETPNIIRSINSAVNGNVYTNVFSPKKIIKELREIKINLPIGIALPIEINTESIPELFKVMDISIIRKDNFIIFMAKLSLVSNGDYKVFKPIPLPIPYDNNSVVLIAPDREYLELSNNNVKFFVLTENRWKACKEFKNHKLCKNNQSVPQRSKSNMREI